MILVVEDAPEQRMILEATINSSNLGPCKGMETAEEALRFLDVDRIDGPPAPVRAILMDVLLPGLDGISATRQISANPRLSMIPIIVVSALEEGERLSAAMAAGASDYLVKPVQPVQLAARMRAALRQSHQRAPHLQPVDSRDELDMIAATRLDRGVLVDVRISDWVELRLELGLSSAEELRDTLIAAFAAAVPRTEKWLHRDEAGGFGLLIRSDVSDGSELLELSRSLARDMPWPSLAVSITCVPTAQMEERS